MRSFILSQCRDKIRLLDKTYADGTTAQAKTKSVVGLYAKSHRRSLLASEYCP